ncbi:LPXTG cell wall anchor domain-containing protein, partial [Leucobacter sp. M11]|uniref:LPXTG cell wall anchor domain-containing protein n=1 Tax=Leucobacter sp. M11 TaxID=2993565 RepID=UPI003FA56A0E
NADADAGPRPAAPSGPKPQLADTGVADSASVLSAAGVLTLAGAAVLLARRRQALQG